MRKSTILLSTAAVMVLSAGYVLGELSSRLTKTPVQAAVPTTAPHDRGWFPDQLGLTSEQHKNMDAIWADVKQQMDKNQDKRKALDLDRDAKIQALLSPEQKAQYDQVFQQYHAERAKLDDDRQKAFRSANDKSRALLTPEQQAKWDSMSKDMHDRNHRGPGGPGGPGNRRGGPGGPSTQPTGNAFDGRAIDGRFHSDEVQRGI